MYVFSRTLRPEDHPRVTVVRDDAPGVVARLRAEAGDGEIWLFGGAALFGSLLAAGQVDAVEVTIVPVLLGGGRPLLPAGVPPAPLVLDRTRPANPRVYPSGMVSLAYRVASAPGADA